MGSRFSRHPKKDLSDTLTDHATKLRKPSFLRPRKHSPPAFHMRDKKKSYEADDMEAELNDREQAREEQHAWDAIVFAAIPDQKPAMRPKEDDAKILGILKRTKLLPENAELTALQTMLDGKEEKDKRAALLASLQALPTTRRLQESYKTLAYQFTFHDPEAAAAANLFAYHKMA